MRPDGIPDALLERFRALSLDRIARTEAAWNLAVQGTVDAAAVRQVLRDLHTLKGDARVIGLDQVHVLAHKLEDLLGLAGEHQFQVSEDFDLVVTMAIQFAGMLLRMKPGASVTGIDLDGFLRQVEEILREARAMPSRRPRSSRAQSAETVDRLSEATRHRLAIAGTVAFLESLSARGPQARGRLRGVWETLRDELARTQAVAIAPLFAAHAAAARELARELGKRASVEVEVDGLRTDARAAEAIGVAALHLIQNAIDHGLEPPEVRAGAGKPEAGSIRIRGRELAGSLEIDVDDDGAGVDLDAVRRRAVARGLIDADRAAATPTCDLLDLLFHPGFSTRDAATEISGRGVGLDAVKSAVLKAGGAVRASTCAGRGSTITIVLPAAARTLHVHHFLSPGGAIALAVSARWTATVDAVPAANAIDPVRAIHLVGHSHQTLDGTRQIGDLGIRLRWGFLELSLRAASEPTLVVADRICPTPDDHPVEIVAIAGRETVLIRPEYLAEAVAGRAAASR